jgi:hypothetical protein
VEEKNEKPEIFSKKVKAGKRTYFFDIKPTKSGDFYLTITESKKRLVDEGFVYEKHKIFLYKEDVKKFSDALDTTIDYLRENLMPDYNFDRDPELDNAFEEESKRNY